MANDWDTVYALLDSYVNSASVDSQMVLIGTMDYQGFDPKAIAAALKRKQENRDRLAADLNFLILLFLSRGNKTTKIIEKSSTATADKIKVLTRLYGIQPGNPKSTDITLSKICATFPQIAYKMMTQLSIPRPCDQWLVAKGLPAAPPLFKTPGACAMLPRSLQDSMVNMNIVKTLLLVGHAESEIISQQNEAYRRENPNAKLLKLIQNA